MKHPKFRIKKKVRLTSIRKLKKEIIEVIEDCFTDIRPYLVKDIFSILKKQGIIYTMKKKIQTKRKTNAKRNLYKN